MMPRGTSALLSCVPALFAYTALVPSCALGEILLTEDFSGLPSDQWVLFGDPLPVICDSMGLPAPSFDNNGDNMYDSGAVSRGSWSSSDGLILECDMFVTSSPRGAWIAGTLALVLTDCVEYGQDQISFYGPRLNYNYCGEANWSCPHLQGQMVLTVILPDGGREEREYLHFNDFLDSWHRYRIVIERDRTMSFYVDSLLLHHTELPLPASFDKVTVVIGNRSNDWGRVYHDNIRLSTLD